MSTSPVTAPKHHTHVPRWLPVAYGVGGFAMMPWIIYLQYTLPPQQSLARWILTWIGFDIAMLVLILLVAVLAFKKSPWLNLALVALATLLLTDAWFDVVTANGTQELTVAVLLAVFFEIPWAILSLLYGVHVNRQLIAAARKGH